MSEQRHTPGPWFLWNGWGPAASDGLFRAARIGPRSGGGIVPPHGADVAGTKADLELAAAAPQILEALESLLRVSALGTYCLGNCRPGVDEHEAGCLEGVARAAIAAACGGEGGDK